jgi:hypothetical protein
LKNDSLKIITESNRKSLKCADGILVNLTPKQKGEIMGMEQIMQALQQNPQLMMQLVQMLIQAGICAPGPKLQQMQGAGGGMAPPGAGGPPRPQGMQPTPGGGPAGAQGGSGMGMGRAAAMGAGRPGGLMR